MTPVSFTVPGEPQGKGRPKIVKIGGFSRMATPQKTVAYEGLVAHEAQIVMAGAPPLTGACLLELDVVCTVAASWSDKKRQQALAGQIRPTKKPDVDNVLKAVCDGMNGVVWVDDVQAVDVVLRKRYGATPAVHVRVTLLGPAPHPVLAARAAPAQGDLLAQAANAAMDALGLR